MFIFANGKMYHTHRNGDIAMEGKEIKHNKQKKTKRKMSVPLFVLVFILATLFEIHFSDLFRYDNYAAEIEVSTEDLIEITGYNVSENKFVPESDDPSFQISNALARTNKIIFYFEESLQQDTAIQVFYATSQNFKEKRSKTGTISSGSTKYVMQIRKGQYSFLRFDIDGEFQLQGIKVCGTARKTNTEKLIIFIILCIVLDGFWVWRFVKEKGSGRGMDYHIGFYSLLQLNDWLYQFGEKRKWNIENMFVVLALVMGIAFLILIPLAQVPDESTHVGFIQSEWGVEGLHEQYVSYLEQQSVVAIMGDYHAKVDIPEYLSHINDKVDYTLLKFHFRPSILMVRHFPAAIGLFLGLLLHIPFGWTLMLGEFFALVFYVLIGKKAIHYMPYKKELLCAIMLLPMTLQQCSSYNYDAVLLPVCFFLLSYILHCRYMEKKTGWKEVTIILLCLGVIAIIKVPYILLGFLVLTIPSDKFSLRIGKRIEVVSIVKKYWGVTLIVCVLLVGMMGYIGKKTFYGKLMIACAQEFPRYCSIMLHTIWQLGGYYRDSIIGNLGWLDTSFPSVFICFTYLNLLVLSFTQRNAENDSVKIRDRIVMGGIFCIVSLLLLTIALQWSFDVGGLSYQTIADMRNSLYQVALSLGVQGRYFLPILFCLFAVIDGIIKIDYKKMILWQILYYGIEIVVSMNVILDRFWLNQ
jgi:uncharacterized membrane protein